MKFTINNKEVIAEQVTEGNLTLAKSMLPAAEVGHWVVTMPDRNVLLMEKTELDKLANPLTDSHLGAVSE